MALASPQIDTELAELAVQMGAFKTGFFCDPGHGAAFACQVKLKIGFFKLVAGFAQGLIEVKTLVAWRGLGREHDVCACSRRSGGGARGRRRHHGRRHGSGDGLGGGGGRGGAAGQALLHGLEQFL